MLPPAAEADQTDSFAQLAEELAVLGGREGLDAIGVAGALRGHNAMG